MPQTTQQKSKKKGKKGKKKGKKGKKKGKTMTEVVPALSASAVRGDQVYSAINKTALLEDVLKANGEEHLYDKIMELSVHVEDDPPVIFGWHNVEIFVQAIQTAQAQAVAPGGVPLPANPLALPGAVNVQSFKEAVLEYVRAEGAAARVDTTCLPCSLDEFGLVVYRLHMLEVEPWIQRIIAVGVPNSLPIAGVYVPRPRSNTLSRITPQYPNSLWG